MVTQTAKFSGILSPTQIPFKQSMSHQASKKTLQHETGRGMSSDPKPWYANHSASLVKSKLANVY